MINHGIIPGKQQRPTDYIGGTLPFQIRIADGNWTPYLPAGKQQVYRYGDTMACVTYSLLNAIMTQELFLTGRQPRYSQRWIAVMSGTDPLQGNYLYLVADAVRKYGLVLESSWPDPDANDPNFIQNYYTKPDPDTMARLQAEGKAWLQTHNFAYEWLTINASDLIQHLQQCPLQVVKPGHAIEDYLFLQTQDIVDYFDSYNPFEKQVARTEITDVLKPLLTMKGNFMVGYKVQGDPTTYVELDGRLVPVADWPAFTAMGGTTDSVIELTAEQFNKFEKVGSVLFKSQ